MVTDGWATVYQCTNFIFGGLLRLVQGGTWIAVVPVVSTGTTFDDLV